MKKCYIIQPGKIGDIIIVLPIAKYYADKGYEVYWFVYEEYLILFEYVNYVKSIPLFCGSMIQDAILDVQGNDIMYDYAAGARAAYYKLDHEISLSSDDLIIDLSIGFSGSKVDEEWMDSGLSFDEWKYKKANVPFSEKYKLQVNEKPGKEEILRCHAGIGVKSDYFITHSVGGMGTYKFDKERRKYNFGPLSRTLTVIEVRYIKGFTIFDWISILKNAKWIYCVDSCAANLANQLGLCKNRRVFKFLQDDKKLFCPKMESDWIILQ